MTDDPVTPAPLDPIVSLAVGMAESPGTYAFLLGSGVSKDAGVPTGGDVLALALGDTYRLEHPEEESPEKAAIESWAIQTGHAQLTYSDILERLCPDPEGRRAYLAKNFEGHEPGEAHTLLARLAAAGLIRVFVTTNFDRLLEQALGEMGITPVVITAPDELARAREREHARCYVLKVHGDYLQQTIRNTAAELAQLDAKIDSELREVFGRFGVVVLGYSGTDEAVGRCLSERSSRYGAYWVSRSKPAGPAAALIEATRARVIRRDSAAAFLSDLERRIAAFRAQPSGATPDAVRSEVVRLLRQGDRVGLRETLREEWRVLEARVQAIVEPRATSQSVERDVAVDVDAELMPVIERMLAALLPLIDYDTDLFSEQASWMTRIVDRVYEGGSGWPELPQWVVWFLAQTCGAFAVCRERWAVVSALMDAAVQDARVGYTLASLIACDVGDLISCGVLDTRRETGATWRYLIERLNENSFVAEHYPEFVEEPGKAGRWANDFNFLVSYRAVQDEQGVVGYWRTQHDGAERLAKRLARDARFGDAIAEICFHVSGDVLRTTIRQKIAEALSQPGQLIYTPGGRGGTSDAFEYLPRAPTA